MGISCILSPVIKLKLMSWLVSFIYQYVMPRWFRYVVLSAVNAMHKIQLDHIYGKLQYWHIGKYIMKQFSVIFPSLHHLSGCSEQPEDKAFYK
jgi:hypothetical protein